MCDAIEKLTIFGDAANFDHVIQICSIVVELDTVIDGNKKFIVFGDLRSPCDGKHIFLRAIDFVEPLKMEIIKIDDCLKWYVGM